MSMFYFEDGSVWSRAGASPKRICGPDAVMGIVFDADEGVIVEAGEIDDMLDSYDRLAAYWRRMDFKEMMDGLDVVGFEANDDSVAVLNRFADGMGERPDLRDGLAEHIVSTRQVVTASPTFN